MAQTNPRLIALHILNRVFAGASLSAALPAGLKAVNADNKSLIQALCYGVLRFYPRLQLISQQLLSKPLKTKDFDIELLIYLGLYQLQMLRIAPHAVVNETVNVTVHIKKPWARGLVNAVLRNYLREAETLDAKLAADPVYHYAHPAHLLKMLQKAWPNDWQAICAANNTHPPMALRVNQQKITRDQYLQQLSTADIPAAGMAYSEVGIYLAQPCDVMQLPGFQDGMVSVQDEAAQLAAPLLDLQPHQRVLDACAAPGGKTAHILESGDALAAVVAIDNQAERVTRLSDTVARLQLADKVIIQQADASTPERWYDGQPFERILLDVPCSATGVIRRHPDIKLHRTREDISALAQTQLQLLKALWPLLKTGGRLLYCTCSVLPAENSDVIAAFLRNVTDAIEIKIIADWGIAQTHGRQILPGVDDNMDGFFYACLGKGK